MEQIRSNTITVVRETDYMWRLEGDDNPLLVGILCATDHLTACKVYLEPGQKSAIQAHGGDKSLYVLDGVVNIHVLDGQRPSWFELYPHDGFYIPEGVEHQLYNITGATASFVCGIAPQYLLPTHE